VVSGLGYLHVEGIVAGEVLLDLVDWQVNEHTGDLRGEVGTDHLDNILVDALSNLTLEMRVSLVDGGKNLGGSHQVLLDIARSSTSLRNVGRHAAATTLHLVSGDLGHSHVGLRHPLLGHATLRWRHSHHLVTAHRLLRHTASHALSTTHVLWHSSAATLVVVHLSRMRSTLLSVSLMSVVHSLLLIVLSILLLVSMDDLHESGQDMGKVGQVGELIPLESSGLGSLILFPISLILGLLVLNLADLLDFVVADVEGLAFKIVVVQVLLSLGSIVGLLEADEGKSISRFALIETNLFDLSELRK